MDYQDLSEMEVSEKDKAFAQRFADFVNGSMYSADRTGRELTRAHRYLQQMFNVFLGFVKQLAYNYRKGFYDERNELASQYSEEVYRLLIEKGLIFDTEFESLK